MSKPQQQPTGNMIFCVSPGSLHGPDAHGTSSQCQHNQTGANTCTPVACVCTTCANHRKKECWAYVGIPLRESNKKREYWALNMIQLHVFKLLGSTGT